MNGNDSIQRKDIEKLGDILNQEGILFGGASLPFYGVSRATEDIDFGSFELSYATLEQVSHIESKLF